MLKVAISDAHALIREGVRIVLESAGGFQVLGEAFDGESTLALVRSTEACLLTLDLAMPGTHGTELIQSIKMISPALRILVLTMRSETAYASSAFKAGASGFVSKHGPTEEFISAARKVAAGGIYVSLAMADHSAQDLSDREVEILCALQPDSRLPRSLTYWN